jgi:hypothetical protein
MAGRFSARSKANLKLAAYSFPWDAMGRRIGMVTLTWPEDLWPDNGPEMARCRRRIVDRWEYRWGYRPEGIWKREFGELKGSPHIHLVTGLPRGESDAKFQGWCVRAWYEVLGCWDSLPCLPGYLRQEQHRRQREGIGMNVSTDFYASVRSGIDAAEYLMRDLGKKGQNELPEGFTKPGRWWGQLGGQVETVGGEICCASRYVQLERVRRAIEERRAKARWDDMRAGRRAAMTARADRRAELSHDDDIPWLRLSVPDSVVGGALSKNEGFGRRSNGGLRPWVRWNQQALKGGWTVARDAAGEMVRLVKWTEQFCTCGFVATKGTDGCG